MKGDNLFGRTLLYTFLQVKNLKVKKIVFRFGAKVYQYFSLSKFYLIKIAKYVA